MNVKLLMLMHWFVLLFFLCISCAFINAQVFEDFSDENLNQDPSWSGELGQFEISNSTAIPSDLRPGLRLNGNDSDTSYLSTENIHLINAEWLFWAKLSFNTSSGNYLRYYLASDQQNLENELNGYFVQLGGTNDSIGLYRQNGGEVFSLINGAFSYTGNSTNILRIKVLHDDEGLWELYADNSGNENYLLEGSALDTTILTSAYTGIFCKYSSSNANKVYFDDLYFGPLIIDTISPEILNTILISESCMRINFSEPITETSLANPANYYVEGKGSPDSLRYSLQDLKIVDLYFSNSFVEEQAYILILNEIEDPAGNFLFDYQFSFVTHITRPYDIVINEIMSDPSPSAGLPEYEYIELYNTSNFPVDMSGWSIMIGSSWKDIKNYSVDAGDYLICCHENAASMLSAYADLITFSSFSISNQGTEIHLLDSSGQTMSYVDFSIDWYNDGDKDEGGWSIEQINPFNPCGEEDNWKASVDTKGGSPGKINSVYDEEILYPKIGKICVPDSNTVKIFFSQFMHKSLPENLQFFSVDREMGVPYEVVLSQPDMNTALLKFAKTFKTAIIYTLRVDGIINNCAGLESDVFWEIPFGLPEIPVQGDIIINEILFNPLSNGEEFLELYNRSSKILDLSGLKLLYIHESPPSPPDITEYHLSVQCRQLLPAHYIVFYHIGTLFHQ